MALEPDLGTRWTRFWKGLGHSLVPLGRLWDACGQFLALLGQLWAGSWALLGRSWAPLRWSGPPLGRILGPRTPPVFHFRKFWRVPGSRFTMVFAAPWALLPNAFFDAVTIFLHSP